MKSLPIENIKMWIDENLPRIQKCYTLFSHSKSSWDKINMVSARYSISLKEDYHAIYRTFYIEFFIHSPKTLPYEGMTFLNTEYVYLVKYSQWNIERLGKGYDTDCREYDPKVYTRNDCLFNCYQDIAKYLCQTEEYY